jgi:hypothetical protein
VGPALWCRLAALVCLDVSEECGGSWVEAERGSAQCALGVMARLSYVVGRTFVDGNEDLADPRDIVECVESCVNTTTVVVAFLVT